MTTRSDKARWESQFLAVAEGQNWTDTPLTRREKDVASMAVDYAVSILAMRPRLYLAGPYVFRPNAQEIADGLKTMCEKYDCFGVSPADVKETAARNIAVTNMDLIRKSDAVVADITPFRGPHMDCGTAYEIGYAVALSKPVFAYVQGSSVGWSLGAAVVTPGEPELISRIWCEENDGVWRDDAGNLVENFGLADNLMVTTNIRGLALTAEAAIKMAAMSLHKPPEELQ